jgi:hypothetical protein
VKHGSPKPTTRQGEADSHCDARESIFTFRSSCLLAASNFLLAAVIPNPILVFISSNEIAAKLP